MTCQRRRYNMSKLPAQQKNFSPPSAELGCQELTSPPCRCHCFHPRKLSEVLSDFTRQNTSHYRNEAEMVRAFDCFARQHGSCYSLPDPDVLYSTKPDKRFLQAAARLQFKTPPHEVPQTTNYSLSGSSHQSTPAASTT
jgi:hypothetical protein